MSKSKENKTYVHDNPDDVKEAKAKAKVFEDIEKNDMILLMENPSFRRFVWKLLERTHIFSSSFTGNSETFFKEGERNVGLKVFKDLHLYAPESYALMVKEHSKGKEE